jgi:hypothetical protein
MQPEDIAFFFQLSFISSIKRSGKFFNLMAVIGTKMRDMPAHTVSKFGEELLFVALGGFY